MTTSAEFYVSTDKCWLDLEFITRALHGSYWAKQRPREVIEQSIAASLCFGAYHSATHEQVGFARVVTDGVTFSWLCDVIVDESCRGRGVGKLLMSAVTAHAEFDRTMCLLGTADAHGLYEQFGFFRSEQMKRLPKGKKPPA